LDVGCATGVFLDMARKQGWDVEGVEISSELASYAREQFSLKVHVLDLTEQKLKSHCYEAICLFDVIEHIPNVNAMIASCKSMLSDSGLLLIRTPTEDGFLRDIAKSIYRTSLNKFELPMLWFYSFEHIQSFSMRSLNTLLKNHGFSIIRIFREEESLDRINIPWYLRVAMRCINCLSGLLNKQHKITVIARKK
jgi:SAM-dependent methyltransferase